jgi:hypothetical protein
MRSVYTDAQRASVSTLREGIRLRSPCVHPPNLSDGPPDTDETAGSPCLAPFTAAGVAQTLRFCFQHCVQHHFLNTSIHRAD